jgi:hypothetical protein
MYKKNIIIILLVIILLFSFYGWFEYRNILYIRLISLFFGIVSLGLLIRSKNNEL